MVHHAILKRISLSILLTIVAPSSFAAEIPVDPSCKAKPVDDPRVQGRARRVTFADGREITIVGHVHGDRQLYKLVDLMRSGQLYRLSDKEFEQLLRGIQATNSKENTSLIFNENRRQMIANAKKKGYDLSKVLDPDGGYELKTTSVLNHAKQDYAYLHHLISAQKADFVGWEGSHEQLVNNFPNYLSAKQILTLEAELRRLRGGITISNAELDEILLSSINGNTYAYIENPKLAERTPLVGTENKTAGQAYDKADSLGRIEEVMKKLIALDNAFFESKTKSEQDEMKKNPKLQEFFFNLLYLKEDVVQMILTPDEFEKRVRDLRESSLPWVKESVEELFQVLRERIMINTARDLASAANLAFQKRSGVHFVGLNHLRNTVTALEKICTQEKPATQLSPKRTSGIR